MHILFGFQSSTKITKHLVKNRPKVSKRLEKIEVFGRSEGGQT